MNKALMIYNVTEYNKNEEHRLERDVAKEKADRCTAGEQNSGESLRN